MKSKIFLVFILLIVPAIASEDFIPRVNDSYNNISEKYSINGNVNLIAKNIKIGSAEAKRYPLGDYAIILDSDKLAEADDFELKGMLSHELAHLESYSKMSFPGFLVFAIKYGLSDDCRKETERETDMRAIEKGLGEELLAFREYRLRTGSEEDVEDLKKYYLSPEEIMRINSGSGI